MFTGTFSVPLYSVFRSGQSISTIADNDVEMNVRIGIVSKALKPSCKRALAFSLGTDEEAFPLRNQRLSWHSSTESWEAA